MDFVTGEVLHFDKPLSWTSFDVVAKVRYHLCRALGIKKLKVGHAGTLDPLATGVLIVCTGRATKRIDELQASTKEYVATLCIGATTPSFDRERPVDAFYPTSHITRDKVEATLKQFIGTIQQIPPAYSAVKVDGDRAYDLARRGKDVELKPKTLVIDEIELLEYEEGVDIEMDGITIKSKGNDNSPSPLRERAGVRVVIRVVCSKGTYIRALARDIGQALGSGAHLTHLRRTRVGSYGIDNALDINDFISRLTPCPLTT